MIKLYDFKNLLNCQLSVREIVTKHYFTQSKMREDDLKNAVMRNLSEQLVQKIRENKQFFFCQPVEVQGRSIGIEFSADVIVLTSEELSNIIKEAYSKGLNSGR